MHIRVNTRDFENSHGRKPRGEGYWGFTLSDGPGEPQEFWTTANYGEAKDQAVAKATRFQYDTVTVLT